MAQIWIEKPEDGDSRFLQKVGINISDYLASQSIKTVNCWQEVW